MRYTFKHTLPSYDVFTGDEIGVARTVTHEFEAETLDEMMENFEMFLRGSGFVFSGDVKIVDQDSDQFIITGSDGINLEGYGAQPSFNIDSSFMGEDIISLDAEYEQNIKS